MKFHDLDYTIPGYMTRRDMQILANIAGLVPVNGKILEIGAWFGRNTKALYTGKNPSVKLSVCDSWKFLPLDAESDAGCGEGNRELFELAKQQAILNQSTRAAFEYCLSDIIADINVIHSDSNQYVFEDHYDFVYIDGDHSYSAVMTDINKHINNPHTLLAGDDFTLNIFDGVIKAVIQSNSNHERTMVIPGGTKTKLWIMIPSSGYWRTQILELFEIIEYYV